MDVEWWRGGRDGESPTKVADDRKPRACRPVQHDHFYPTLKRDRNEKRQRIAIDLSLGVWFFSPVRQAANIIDTLSFAIIM